MFLEMNVTYITAPAASGPTSTAYNLMDDMYHAIVVSSLLAATLSDGDTVSFALTSAQTDPTWGLYLGARESSNPPTLTLTGSLVTATPTAAPTAVPISALTAVPLPAPTAAPLPAPTAAPLPAPTTPSPTATSASTLYVSTDGDNSTSGAIDAPLATLQACVDAVPTVGGVCVLRGGTYHERVFVDGKDGLKIAAHAGEADRVSPKRTRPASPLFGMAMLPKIKKQPSSNEP